MQTNGFYSSLKTKKRVLPNITPLFVSGVFILCISLNLYANGIPFKNSASGGFIQPLNPQVKSQDNLEPKISYLDKIREHLRRVFSKKRPETKQVLSLSEELGGAVKSIFKPTGITLDESIEIGLANNLDVQITQEQIKLSRLKLNEALRVMFPAVTAKYEQKNAKLDEPYRGKEYNIEIEQPIFYSGQLKYAYLQAKTNLELSRINLKRAESDLLVDIVKVYYNLLRNKFNLAYQQELIREAKKDLTLAEREFKHDIIPKIEFLNIQSLFNEVDYRYHVALKDLALSEINFRQILNLGPKEEVDIKPELSLPDIPDIKDDKSKFDIDIDLDECVDLALENHWESRLNKLLVRSSKYGMAVAKSKGGPKVSLVGRLGKGAEAYDTSDLKPRDEWFIGAKMSWSFGGSTIDYIYSQEETFAAISKIQSTEGITQTVKLSLLDNLKYFSDKKQAEIDYQQAINRLRSVEQKVVGEVKENYYKLQKALIEIKASENERELREKQLAILELKRKENEATISEVLSARVELAHAKTSYIDSIANYYLSLATLNKAMGISGYQKEFKVAAK